MPLGARLHLGGAECPAARARALGCQGKAQAIAGCSYSLLDDTWISVVITWIGEEDEFGAAGQGALDDLRGATFGRPGTGRGDAGWRRGTMLGADFLWVEGLRL